MPDKNRDSTVSFRIAEIDKQALIEMARKEERSLSQLIRFIIQDYLNNKQ